MHICTGCHVCFIDWGHKRAELFKRCGVSSFLRVLVVGTRSHLGFEFNARIKQLMVGSQRCVRMEPALPLHFPRLHRVIWGQFGFVSMRLLSPRPLQRYGWLQHVHILRQRFLSTCCRGCNCVSGVPHRHLLSFSGGCQLHQLHTRVVQPVHKCHNVPVVSGWDLQSSSGPIVK